MFGPDAGAAHVAHYLTVHNLWRGVVDIQLGNSNYATARSVCAFTGFIV